jgi:hypothetical protein
MTRCSHIRLWLTREVRRACLAYGMHLHRGDLLVPHALRNLQQETPAFVEEYGKHIGKGMKQPNARHLRRAFDPNPKDDFGLILGPVVLAQTSDSHISSSATPIAQNEGVRVKWRILLKLLLFHVQIQHPTGEDGLTTGGTGIVCARGRDTRLWDFMCLVNDSLIQIGRYAFIS